MLQKMIMGSSDSGGGIDFDILDTSTMKSNYNNSLASQGNLDVTVTAIPKFIYASAFAIQGSVVIANNYLYDVENGKLAHIQVNSNGNWNYNDKTSEVANIFPTVSASLVRFKNNSSQTRNCGCYCYY